MRKNDNVHLFRILDAMSKDGDLTQRTLSERVGVALGLTNLYVRRLAKIGWIKVINLKPNRLRYELTPTGIAQKTTMAFQYVQDSYVFYREARKSLTNTFDGLRTSGVRSVLLYGTGDLAEIALLSLQEAHLDLAGIVSANRSGQNLCGRPVLGPDAITSLRFDHVIVVDQNPEAAITALQSVGVEASRIARIGQ
ncbi:MAG: winged helix-turn-helix transcriptional regulator [Nitrospirota bacterium]